jgi:hypothetical protein
VASEFYETVGRDLEAAKQWLARLLGQQRCCQTAGTGGGPIWAVLTASKSIASACGRKVKLALAT